MTHDELLDILDTLDILREQLLTEVDLIVACHAIDEAVVTINAFLDDDFEDDDDPEE